MKKQIQKGTEEAMFWIDLMKFRQEYYSAMEKNKLWSKDDIKWQNLCDKAEKFTDKYKGLDFYPMAVTMVTAYVGYLETEWRRRYEKSENI